MNYNQIIDNVEKYHYLVCGNNSCKTISKSDSKKEAKEEFIDIMKDKWDDMIDEIIYLVVIRNSVKGNWDPKKYVLVSGPLYMEIVEYKVEDNYKLKLISSGINGNVYFTENYLKKNNKIKKEDIKKMVLKFKKRELKKGLMEDNLL
jgi:hypothetical protein